MIRIERPGRFLVFVVGLGVLLTVAILGSVRLVFGPAAVVRGGELIVPEGKTAGAIWQQAVDEGFTSGTFWWRYHAWRQDAGADIKAGTYELTAGEKINHIMARLVAGGQSTGEISITFPEGFTLAQMAARTAARGIGTEDEFIQAATPALYASEVAFLAEIPASRDLEGYLFPDTYRVLTGDAPPDVIRRMLTVFDQKFTNDLRQEARAAGRTLDQIVTMASIIEREVRSDEDMAQVAGVLWKRFDDGVGLDADATVRYAVEKWDEPLTAQDLQIDSPYNTRRYRGLPPGPISNPGLRALIAAVRPQQSDYYYYLSAPTGETIFSRTLEEHNQNKARHLR
jgi:UPF0755 protein